MIKEYIDLLTMNMQFLNAKDESHSFEQLDLAQS